MRCPVFVCTVQYTSPSRLTAAQRHVTDLIACTLLRTYPDNNRVEHGHGHDGLRFGGVIESSPLAPEVLRGAGGPGNHTAPRRAWGIQSVGVGDGYGTGPSRSNFLSSTPTLPFIKGAIGPRMVGGNPPTEFAAA